MTVHVLSADDLDEAVERLKWVMEAFDEEEEGPPTLGEFLEIAGWAVPAGSEFMGAFPVPLTFKAKLTGNRRYKAPTSDRVAGLNDNTFTEMTEFLAFLVGRAGTQSGEEVSSTDLPGFVLQVLTKGTIEFADISSERVVELTVDPPKRTRKSKIGDVVAIPSGESAYRLAVVLAHNHFGMAIGLLNGTHAVPRLGDTQRHSAAHIPIHTGTDLIEDGTWPLVGHDEAVLDLFPGSPEIYHQAVTPGGRRLGEFGAAETPDGELRPIGKDEAEQIGLLDETYHQVYLAAEFQQMLSEGRFDSGPAPGVYR